MESEYKKVLLILAEQLTGPGGFDCRPLDYQPAQSYARFASSRRRMGPKTVRGLILPKKLEPIRQPRP